jgi:hypothetical protein
MLAQFFLETASAFVTAFLHLLAGEGAGEGTVSESLSPSSLLEIFLLFSLFSNSIVALRDSAEPDLCLAK